MTGILFHIALVFAGLIVVGVIACGGYLVKTSVEDEFADQPGALFVSYACSGRTPQHLKCGGQCNYGTGLKPCECSCHEPEPEPRVPLLHAALDVVVSKVTRPRKNGSKT